MPLPAIAPENVTGLATDEAARRLVEFGVNDAMPAVSRGIAWRLLDRLRNPLLLLLMAASVVAALVGDLTSAVVSATVALLSMVLDVTQEYRADRAAEELRRSVQTQATVVRDGQTSLLPMRDLVPGDVVKLDAGCLIPADLRVLQANDLFEIGRAHV